MVNGIVLTLIAFFVLSLEQPVEASASSVSGMSETEVEAFPAELLAECNVPGTHSNLYAAIDDANCDIVNLAAGNYISNKVVSQPKVLRGAGEDVTFLSGFGSSNTRVLFNQVGNSLTLEDLTVRNGTTSSSFDGAGIYNSANATLTLRNVTFHNNDSERSGGAIYNAGVLSAENTTFTDNEAANGGAIFNAPNATLHLSNSTLQTNNASYAGTVYSRGYGGGVTISGRSTATITTTTFTTNTARYGGAIYLASDDGSCGGYGDVTISDSVIHNNQASGVYYSGGGAIYGDGTNCGRAVNSSAAVQILNTQFTDNHAGYGGAINIRYPISVQNATFDGNHANIGGAINLYANWDGSGSIAIQGSTFTDNQATFNSANSYDDTGHGGAIHAEGGTLDIAESEFVGNSAEYGGAISISGSTTIETSTFTDNDVNEDGGAIFTLGELSVFNSYFDENSAYRGGHVASDGTGGINLHRSTLSNGFAAGGGAVWAMYSTYISNSTLSDNWATYGGSALTQNGNSGAFITNSTIYNTTEGNYPLFNQGSTINVEGSIIANPGGTNCLGTVGSRGYNLTTDSSCNFADTGDIQTSDPRLGSLQDNGGATLTHMPLDHSPALDNSLASCSITGIDQRGGLRYRTVTPLGKCDIGAVEVDEDILFNYASPWERYFNWAQVNYLTPAQTFRTQTLTSPADDDITTITELTQNFATFSNGRLFYRYCADDHTTITAGQPCNAWGDGDGNGHDIGNLNQHPDMGNPVSVDNYNALLTAIDAFEQIELGPQRDITVTLDGVQTTAPLQTLTLSATVDALTELSNIPQIYGNEFMVDALRYSFGPAQQFGATTGEQMIQDEIDQLEEARTQFQNATEVFIWAVENGWTDGFSAEDFETFTLASERYIEVTIEIVERRRLLGESPVALMMTLDEASVTQYLQAALIAKAIEETGLNADDSQALFLDNGGWRVMNNLENLQHLADSIRNETNLLGYDSLYVPRSSLDDMLARMGTLGTCDVNNGTVIGGDGELNRLLVAECAAGSADRAFDQDAGELADEIDALSADFKDNLVLLCGGDPDAPGWNPQACSAGEMGINYAELEAAQQAAGLAWQRAQNIPELIKIEQDRASQIIQVTLQTGEQISAEEQSIGMLKAYREVTTSSTTTEIWAPGSDPNDPSSGAYWLDFGKDALNCLLSGATAGALGDGCQGNNDNLFGAIGDLAGIEDKPTAIETVDTISDPNQNQIGVHKGMIAIRDATRDATITGANSNAEIRRLLLEQADLLIEYEIAVDELNRVIVERNLLIQQHRRALSEYLRLINNIQDDFISRPPYRIIRDQTANNAESARDRTIQLTYLTIKALEYQLLAEPTVGVASGCNSGLGVGDSLYHALYRARTAAHLAAIICEVETIELPLADSNGNRYPVIVSIAQDVWGLTNARLTPLLPHTPDPASTTWPTDATGCNGTITTVEVLRFCFFQERLRSNVLDNADVRVLANDSNLPQSGESVYFNFNTQLERDVEDGNYGRWNMRIADNAMCGGVACGVRVNMRTQQAFSGLSPISIFLTHQGQATYRTASGNVTMYNPGLTALYGQQIPDGWPSGSAVNAAIVADVNGSGGFLNNDLTNLSAATTDWRLRLNLDPEANEPIDVTQIEDFIITMDTKALTTNRARVAEIDAAIADGDATDEMRAERTELLAIIERDAMQPLNSRAVNQSVEPEIVFSDDVIGGTYSGNVIVDEPVSLGIIDFGVTITRTGNSLTGELCKGCSPLWRSVPISGTFAPTGTPTDTFSFTSAPLVQTIDGQTVTRTVTVSGIVYRDGDVMEGTYTETIKGYGDTVIVVEGELIGNRPMQFYAFDNNAVPTAVTLSTQGATSPHLFVVLAAIPLLFSASVLLRRRA